MEQRLVIRSPLVGPPPSPAGTMADPEKYTGPGPRHGSFDANVIMVLAALVCTVIFSIAVNVAVRCVLRLMNRVWFGPEPPGSPSRVGRKEALRALPTLVYSAGLGLPLAGSECAICLSEFEAGERVRVLPKCNHGFHVRCIDRWLACRSSCPMCRQGLFGPCQVICIWVQGGGGADRAGAGSGGAGGSNGPA